MRLTIAALLVLLSLVVAPLARADELSLRREKPQNVFFYPQLNVAGGYDTAEPGDGWGLADRGARSQLALELFVKHERRMQRGYTRLIEPISYNLKLAIELDPEEGPANRRAPDLEWGDWPKARLDDTLVAARLRLLDTWVKLDTKWDRTSIWLGHRGIPYGHNPRIDPGHAFLPNQASLDLSFGRDTGVFLKTPLSKSLDLECSVTAGKGDTFDYHGGWLVTARVGRPSFVENEIGGFALLGRIQRTSGSRTTNRDLTRLFRIGADWVHKHGETWKLVNQVSWGGNQTDSMTCSVLNVLNDLEVFVTSWLTVGVQHVFRHERSVERPRGERSKGTILGSLSFAPTRDIRFRVNPFVEYRDSAGERDSGVMFQICIGCGLER